MFLSFSIAGAFLRPFVYLLQTATKQGDGLFFEPHKDVLLIRVVNASHSIHFLVNIASCHLEAYRCVAAEQEASANADTDATQPSLLVKDAQNNSSSNECSDDSNNAFFLHLPTKALAATVLRQVHGLCRLHFRYDGGPTTCDKVQWECVMTRGITKKFMLPLLCGVPERAHVSPDVFRFDACASARVWCVLLSCFSASTSRIVVQPLNGRLEMWAVGHPGRDGVNTNDNSGDTRVSASREQFLYMQLQHVEHNNNSSRHDNAQSSENNESNEIVSLPGKVIESRPLKQACVLAEQLGLVIRLRSGEEGLALFLEAVTPQEAQQLLTNAAVSTNSSNRDPLVLLNKHAASSETSLRVKFSMYIAAFDVPQRVLMECSCDATRLSHRRSTNSTTTATGTMEEGSTVMLNADPSFSSQMPSALSALREVQSKTSAPHTAMHKGANVTVNSVCTPPRVLVPASPTQYTHSGQCLSFSAGMGVVGTMTSETHGVSTSQQHVDRINTHHHSTCTITGGKRMRKDSSPFTESRSTSYVAATCVSPNDGFKQQLLPSMNDGQLSINPVMPLNFSTYLQELTERGNWEEEGENRNEEDDRIQYFLETCASTLIVPGTPTVISESSSTTWGQSY